MIIRTTVCDWCRSPMQETDADGDEQRYGIFAEGKIEFKVNEHNETGSSSWFVLPIVGGDFCSLKCFEAHVSRSVDDLRRFKAREQGDAVG